VRRIFLVGILFQVFLSSCGQSPKNINQLSSEKFHELISSDNSILLDVRTKHEFENEHLKNAEQLNYYAVDFRQKMLLLPKNQSIYLYCNTGYRSEKAAEILIKITIQKFIIWSMELWNGIYIIFR
jgi:rhodanese-related sulfurtransferase